MNFKNNKYLADQFLIDKVLSGDTNAFKAIIKNTEGLVTQIIFKMIPNKEDRKDIAQDIYLKTFQNLGTFKFQSKLSTWIGQIAYNTCINYLEKKKFVLLDNKNDSKKSAEESLEMLDSKVDYFNSETEERIHKKELSELLEAEINKLSPVYKTLITLYHNEELNYSEIAGITELPIGTVKNYLFRARKILRNNLWFTYKKEE